jgi:hypothetical protein
LIAGYLALMLAAFTWPPVAIALVASLVVPLRRQRTRVAVRVAGSWIAASGLLRLGWNYAQLLSSIGKVTRRRSTAASVAGMTNSQSKKQRRSAHAARPWRCWCRAVLLTGAMSGCPASLLLAQTRSLNDDQGVVEINDPTSPLRWFQLSDWYNASLHDESGSINDGVFRAVLPFTVAGDLYAVRFTEQYTISAPNGKTGFQDPELILLRAISETWGRWLVGLVVRPPTGAESQTSHAWSLGPALGLVTSSEAPVQYGAYLRTWWSVDAPSNAKPVGIINLQPVLNFKLGHGQALSLGQTQLEYDTVAARWKSLQLGLKYDKAFTIADRKWAPYLEADYDFQDSKGNPMWTLRVGITMFEAEK